MNEIYLILEVQLDRLENKISNAIYKEVLGYTTSLEEASKYIEETVKNKTTYKGWDDEYYPRYEIETIYKL